MKPGIRMFTPLSIAPLAVFTLALLPVTTGVSSAQFVELGRRSVARQSPFIQAVFAGDLAAVKAMLDKDPELINQTNQSGLGALYNAINSRGEAAEATRLEMIGLLLTRGADPNVSGKDAMHTPLISAVIQGRRDVVALLLSPPGGLKGADPNIADTQGLIALQHALNRERVDIASLLVNGGVNLKAELQNGQTPLHVAVAAATGAVPVVEGPPAFPSFPARPVMAPNPFTGIVPTTGVAASATSAERSEAGVRLVQAMLDKGADPNARTRTGTGSFSIGSGAGMRTLRGLTPLHLAATGNSTRVVQLLLDHKADINARNEAGETPLHAAARSGSEMARLLLEKGADATLRDAAGNTALHAALHLPLYGAGPISGAHPGYGIRRNDGTPSSALSLAALQALVARSDFAMRGAAGLSPLALALVTRDKPARDAIATAFDAAFDAARAPQRDAIDEAFDAAAQNDVSRLSRLLEAKPYLASMRLANGWTPLHIAAYWAAPATVELLLKKKADANARDAQGVPPLLRIVGPEPVTPAMRQVVKLLLAAGADVNASAEIKEYAYRFKAWNTPTTDTILNHAIGAGDRELVELALANGARVNQRTVWHDTPLLLAIWGRRGADIVSLLIEKGADVNAANRNEGTPLISAISAGDYDMVKLLIDKGANVNLAGRQTPLVYAIMARNVEIARLLIDKGADVNAAAPGSLGMTPLARARDHTNNEFTELLRARGATNEGTDRRTANREQARQGRKANPLLQAVQAGDVAKVTELLDQTPEAIKEAPGGETLLHAALRSAPGGKPALAARLAVVSILLERKADVNARDASGETPLMVAMGTTSEGIKDIVTLLLDKGANPKIANELGQTPLHRATDAAIAAIATALLAHGADANAADSRGDTPLHSNATQEPVVAALLAAGADANRRNHRGDLPLHIALRTDRVPLALIEKTELTVPDSFGLTPLQRVAVTGNRQARERIVARAPARDELTVLFDAVAQNDAARLQPLLAAQAHITLMRLPTGATPLHIAAHNLAPDATRLLLAAGADPNARDGNGMTPLASILYRTNTTDLQMKAREVVRLLAEKGADLNALPLDGRPALHRALTGSDKEVVALLLQRGANPNMRDERNLTPLHALVMTAEGEQATAMAALLIEKGADLNSPDDAGHTPLAHAARRGHNEWIGFLLDKGAAVNTRNSAGATPLALALQSKHTEAADLLRRRGGVE